jgi:hypothetical protein
VRISSTRSFALCQGDQRAMLRSIYYSDAFQGRGRRMSKSIYIDSEYLFISFILQQQSISSSLKHYYRPVPYNQNPPNNNIKHYFTRLSPHPITQNAVHMNGYACHLPSMDSACTSVAHHVLRFVLARLVVLHCCSLTTLSGVRVMVKLSSVRSMTRCL